MRLGAIWRGAWALTTTVFNFRATDGTSAVILNVSTPLETSPDEAWSLIKKSSTFAFVTRGLLRLRDQSQLPREWHAGQTVRSRLILLGFLPAWMHELRVLTVDDTNRLMQTAEKSGPLRRWDHTLAVTPNDETGSTYTDTINLEAGPLTPIAAPIARLFFHYRQSRLRRLARREVSRQGRGARENPQIGRAHV